MQVFPGSLDHLSKVLEDRHWDESGEVCVGSGVGRVCQIMRGTEYWRTIAMDQSYYGWLQVLIRWRGKEEVIAVRKESKCKPGSGHRGLIDIRTSLTLILKITGSCYRDLHGRVAGRVCGLKTITPASLGGTKVRPGLLQWCW